MRVRSALVLALVTMSLPAMAFDYTPGYRAGAPTEMSRLAGLEGEWEIELQLPADDGAGGLAWRSWGTSRSTVAALLGGAALEERSSGFPFEAGATGTDGLARWEYAAFWTYDRFRGTYRVVVVDSVQGLAEVLEGGFGDTELALSNLGTGTSSPLGSDGGPQKTRLVLSDLGRDRFILTWWHADESLVAQAGAADLVPWTPAMRMIYQRQGTARDTTPPAAATRGGAASPKVIRE